MSTITVTKLDGSTEQIESNDDIVVHGVDAGGVYLGLVPEGSAHAVVPHPPPGPGHVWVNGAGERTRTLVEAQAQALLDIDTAAGAARLRYITEVPGQQGVYVRKAEQARAFAAAGYPAEDVPPYVQAEADSMPAGTTVQQAADSILAIAAYWDDVLSPTIERLRLSAKRAVQSAASVAEVDTIVADAVADLAAV